MHILYAYKNMHIFEGLECILRPRMHMLHAGVPDLIPITMWSPENSYE